MSEIAKVERKGKIATLYSPGYGAGWASWNKDYLPEIVFDADIVQFILSKSANGKGVNGLSISDRDELEKLAAKKYPDAYLGGLEQVRIEWVKKGTKFVISEYDGFESVDEYDPDEYLEA